jgi:ElaB/YqjD/DUF883 family membrane-anchored ribosome-binding protein
MFRSTGSKANDWSKDMADDNSSIVSNAKEKARYFKNQAQDTAKAVENSLEDAAARAGRNARKMFVAAEHNVEDVSNAFVSTVRQKPFTSIAAAAVAGIFVGLLYRR